ncbi:MAG TPA: hypothetical protein VFI35_03190 [Actinomycetota bacterium]|nr:hypothetical protein [Actinomycetota bacterium]
MDTRRWIGRAALVTGIAVMLGAWRAQAGIAISGGTPDQQAMGQWAEDRFADAGIGVPSLEVRFHRNRGGCDDRLGLYDDGVAHICGLHVNDLSRRNLLHEMAHGWVESHVSASLEVRFLRLRQLETWNDHDAEWEERGTEHAAEIISWAIAGQPGGTGMPSIPMNYPSQLAAAYELLTGHPLPD